VATTTPPVAFFLFSYYLYIHVIGKPTLERFYDVYLPEILREKPDPKLRAG
jgi:hypothetical protein